MPDSASRRVGVIGLGRMGGAMAVRLLAAGHAVAGFDVNADAVARLVACGGKAADTPAAAARQADVLLVVVHDATQAEEVLFGAGDSQRDGTRAIDALSSDCIVWLASTVSPSDAASMAARLAKQGVACIDGPVSGGMTGAKDGSLVAICGATPEAMARASFALRACAHRIYRVGDAGAGSTVKLINQLLVASHSALASEAMALAMRAGVDAASVIEVISDSAGSSRMFEKRAPRIAADDHAVHVSIDTLHKDLAIAIAAAEHVGVDPAMARCARGLWRAAAEAGHGAESDTSLVQDYLHTRTL